LAQERAEEAQRTWEKLRVGAVVSGTVSSLRDFGAFVDLGGVDGLIPIGELAYDRVKHPSDKLSVGDRVDVQVIRVEEQAVEGKLPRRQVALSLKALAADPWQSAAERFPVGSSVTGTVRRLEQFGAFVELEPGLEGLVHISKMSLDRRLSHARQAVSEGDRVQVTVLGVDPAQRRVSLSMVEKARRERDAEVAADRAEQGVLLEKANRPCSFGTFGDLLAASRGERKRRE
jgi:small subunit ribosomal protein S1